MPPVISVWPLADRDQRRVPPTDLHRGELLVPVVLRVERPEVLRALPGSVRERAAPDQHPAVGQQHVAGAEQVLGVWPPAGSSAAPSCRSCCGTSRRRTALRSLPLPEITRILPGITTEWMAWKSVGIGLPYDQEPPIAAGSALVAAETPSRAARPALDPPVGRSSRRRGCRGRSVPGARRCRRSGRVRAAAAGGASAPAAWCGCRGRRPRPTPATPDPLPRPAAATAGRPRRSSAKPSATAVGDSAVWSDVGRAAAP